MSDITFFSDLDVYKDFYNQHGQDFFPLDRPKCTVKFSETAPGCV